MNGPLVFVNSEWVNVALAERIRVRTHKSGLHFILEADFASGTVVLAKSSDMGVLHAEAERLVGLANGEAA